MSQEKQPTAAAAVEKPAESDWRTGKQTAYDRYAHLLETGIGADVFFLVGKPGDVQELIGAHKLVLFTGSSVFEGQFRFGSTIRTQEGSEEKPIEVQDISPDAFRAMLKFLYSNDFSGVTKQNIMDVFYAAKKYLLDHLIEQCRKSLTNGQHLDANNIVSVLKCAQGYDDQILINHCRKSLLSQQHFNANNVLSVLEHAKGCADKELVDHCWSFVDKNAMATLKSEQFLALNQQELCELFSRDTLDVSELFLFQSLHRWAINTCKVAKLEPAPHNLQSAVGNVFHHIRFPLVTQEQFTNEIVPTGLLSDKDIIVLYVHFNSGKEEAKRRYPNRFNGQQRRRQS